MRTRPLCVGCGVFTIVLFLLLTFFPIRSYNVTTLLDKSYSVQGYVDQIKYRNDTYHVYIRTDSKAISATNVKGVIAYLKSGADPPHIGSYISVTGKVADFSDATNEGEFSLKRYYQIRGMDFALRNARVLYESSNYSHIKHNLFLLNIKLCKVLKSILPENYANILEAMLLGNKDDLEDDTKLLYQRCGISHALCISGMHISLIGMAVYEILKRLFGLRIRIAIIVAALLITYGSLCGNSSATQRAVIMFVIMAFGDATGRAYDMSTSLCLSCIMALIKTPLLLFDSGFLLSYMAVLSVAVVMPVFRRLFRRYINNKYINSFVMSLSVSIFTLPVTLYFFYQYPVYSILLNIIVVPLMSVLAAFGFAALFAGCISVKIGMIIAIPCRVILKIIEAACQLTECLPGNVLITGRPSMLQIAIYYLIICFALIIFNGRREKYIPIVTLVAVLILLIKPVRGLELTVIDVGQGNSIFMRTADCSILSDAGSSDIDEVGRYRIIPFLKSKGVSSLDAIFISHTDADHISAVYELISQHKDGIRIKRIYMSKNSIDSEEGRKIAKLCEKNQIKLFEMNSGDVISKNDLTISCLYPDKSYRDEANRASEVLLINYKDFSALLPGDLEGDFGEAELIKRLTKKVSCYVVAHHGSKGSSSMQLLNKIAPTISLISCGRKNLYGHPHKELIERLNSIASKIYVTSKAGEITVFTDGRHLSLQTFIE